MWIESAYIDAYVGSISEVDTHRVLSQTLRGRRSRVSRAASSLNNIHYQFTSSPISHIQYIAKFHHQRKTNAVKRDKRRSSASIRGGKKEEETNLRNGFSGTGDGTNPVWKTSTIRGHLDLGS